MRKNFKENLVLKEGQAGEIRDFDLHSVKGEDGGEGGGGGDEKGNGE